MSNCIEHADWKIHWRVTEAAGLIALVDGLTVQATFAPDRMTAARQLALLDERLAELGLG